MSQAPITPITLQGTAGKLAGWVVEPPAGSERRGTVLLVPGFTGSKEDFEGILPLLAEAGYRAVTYDQRGQYESDGPEDVTAYAMADFVGDLLGVVDQISPDAPIHLVGHSFGGYVSRVAVVERPQRFRTLTLLASGPSTTENLNFPPPALLVQLIETGGQQALWDQMSAMMAASGQPPTPQRLEFMGNRILRTRKANLIGIMTAMQQLPLRDPSPLRNAGVPLLVAYGDTGDIWTPDVHEAFAKQIHAKTAVYHGSGHVPNEDVPEQVFADLVTFWKEQA
ncbi:alpha/beta fold hydrolase [Nocardia sp. NPDC101769]|uniref:alpha/beta fold hydrolase n=1 Tax=Nocardia sp. NPDC101769 TaxID=3364333 RepID=UPI00381EDD43